MVRATGAEFSEACGVLGIDEAQDCFVILNSADETLLLADLAAQPRKNLCENFLADIGGKTLMELAAEHGRIAAFPGIFLFDELGGALDEIEREVIALLVIIGPIDKAVLAHHDAFGFGMFAT